jgi:hypothetical protein
MLRRSLIALILIALTGSSLSSAAPKRGPDVIVVSDTLVDTPEALRPSPGRPIHYMLLGNVERALGVPFAGERPPDLVVLNRELERTLASQGYVRTQIGGPMPALAIVVTWGSANLLLDEIEGSGAMVFNRKEIAALVGADQANDRILSAHEADAINSAARQDRLFVVVAAFDAAALARREKKLVWRTRISVDSLRTTLTDSLPVMFASAAPWFGRKMEKPMIVTDEIRRRPEVHLGTPVILPDEPGAAPSASTEK